MKTNTIPHPAIQHRRNFQVHNPFDGCCIGYISETSVDDIQLTVKRALKAAAEFRGSTPHERRSLLEKIAALIKRDADQLANTVCAEVGKTITEARNEIRRAQNTLKLSGDASTFLDGEVMHCGIVEGGVDRQAVVTYVPTGVVAAITPFNYPVNLLCHKLGPALAAGNAIVIKPSPKAPLAAQHVVELCKEAGAPEGLIQIIHGGADAAVALAKSPINLLSFTGGPQAGLALKQASGLVRCLMELGGNDPLFIMPDGDLDAAAKTAVVQRFEIAGQSCAAVKKLYVHEDIKADFIDRVMAITTALTTGNPADPATNMGPVIDELAAQDVSNRLDQAIELGGRILAGGNNDKALFEPTIIENVAEKSKLFSTETFGPVLAIRGFTDLNVAITEVNRSDYGLQAGIYSNNHAQIRLLARTLQVGGIMVNEGPDFRAEHVPFGGIKKSGLGREGVRIALREMSETRVVID